MEVTRRDEFWKTWGKKAQFMKKKVLATIFGMQKEYISEKDILLTLLF